MKMERDSESWYLYYHERMYMLIEVGQVIVWWIALAFFIGENNVNSSSDNSAFAFWYGSFFIWKIRLQTKEKAIRFSLNCCLAKQISL